MAGVRLRSQEMGASPVVVNLAVRLEVAEQSVDFGFKVILRRLLSETLLVDVAE